MTYEVEFNARSVPPTEVASSFIPPESHFARLLARNHTLILGPRGSGKTTLLKMLTARALDSWSHPKAADYANQVRFNAAFIQADAAWGRQLQALEELSFRSKTREAAFVLHTLRALVFAMREAVELNRASPQPHTKHLGVELSPRAEEEFAKAVRESLGIQPPLATLLGVELALEAKLNSINRGSDDTTYTAQTLPSMVALLITAFNGLAGDNDRRWALLFDELEIAPPNIQNFLLSGIRSFDNRVVVKLAMAPYMEEVGFARSPTAPQPLHDYSTIQLTYPNKGDAVAFSESLFYHTLERLGLPTVSLSELFVSPALTSGFGRKAGPNRKRSAIPDEFLSLANKDDSFREYMVSRNLFSPRYKFTEDSIARDIRKVMPIVISRDYYLRRFESGRSVVNRSRKSHALYTGYPSIIEITEGNPRAILTLIGPLVKEQMALAAEGRALRVPSWLQDSAVRRVELLLTSLLQVIPLDVGGIAPRKGLLDFVDQIGRALERRLLRGRFTPDYVGSFVVDDNVTPEVIAGIGKALNAGALIHVPFAEGGADSLLRGIHGQRFRLSYALAARYRLLLTLGDRINLSTLLMETKGAASFGLQASLFGPDADDHD